MQQTVERQDTWRPATRPLSGKGVDAFRRSLARSMRTARTFRSNLKAADLSTHSADFTLGELRLVAKMLRAVQRIYPTTCDFCGQTMPTVHDHCYDKEIAYTEWVEAQQAQTAARS